jgi:hypothetical protein
MMHKFNELGPKQGCIMSSVSYFGLILINLKQYYFKILFLNVKTILFDKKKGGV